jgi:hypothetical protein
MTIASQVTQAQVPCNGTTTQFSFANKIFEQADLIVTLIDTLGNEYFFANTGFNTYTNAATGLSYVISNIDVDTGCYITFSAAPTAGWLLDMRTRIFQIQQTSIKNQGNFLPELHEDFFDRATRMLQDLFRLTYTYGMHGDDIETVPWPSVGTPAQRANSNLGFDPFGNLTTSQNLASGTLSAGSIGSFLFPQTGVEASLGITPTFPQYPADPYVDPRRYGADPTGVTDSTIAVQTAINVTVAAAGRLRIADCTFLVGALTASLNGNLANGIYFEGSSNGCSVLQLNGTTPAAFLTITGPTPSGSPAAVPFYMDNIQLAGGTTATDGLLLQGIAWWRIRNCVIRGLPEISTVASSR